MIKMKKLSATTFAMALSLGGLALAGGCEKNDGQKQETTPSPSPPAVTPAVQTQPPADKPAPDPAAQVPADKPADPAAAQGDKPAVEQKDEPGEDDGCGGCGAPPPKKNPAPDTVTTEKKPAPHGCGKKGCG